MEDEDGRCEYCLELIQAGDEIIRVRPEFDETAKAAWHDNVLGRRKGMGCVEGDACSLVKAKPCCTCCYEEHVNSGGVSDDFDGGAAPTVGLRSTGEVRCNMHRDVGRRKEEGVGFEEPDPEDQVELGGGG